MGDLVPISVGAALRLTGSAAYIAVAVRRSHVKEMPLGQQARGGVRAAMFAALAAALAVLAGAISGDPPFFILGAVSTAAALTSLAIVGLRRRD
jgi:hypothetical protein